MLIGRSYGGSPARSWPSSRMRPEVGVSKPASMRSSVRLAAARRAEQREDLALGDVQADMVDGQVAAEVLHDVLDLQEGQTVDCAGMRTHATDIRARS